MKQSTAQPVVNSSAGQPQRTERLDRPADAPPLRQRPQRPQRPSQIAARLYLSEASVKGYVSRMLDKLGCANRAQAGLLAHDAPVSSARNPGRRSCRLELGLGARQAGLRPSPGRSCPPGAAGLTGPPRAGGCCDHLLARRPAAAWPPGTRPGAGRSRRGSSGAGYRWRHRPAAGQAVPPRHRSRWTWSNQCQRSLPAEPRPPGCVLPLVARHEAGAGRGSASTGVRWLQAAFGEAGNFSE